jgi:hypothetical protein
MFGWSHFTHNKEEEGSKHFSRQLNTLIFTILHNLLQYHTEAITDCPCENWSSMPGLCKRLNEDGAHLFFRCRGTCESYLTSTLRLDDLWIKLVSFIGPKQVITKSMRQDIKNPIKLHCFLLWTWWRTRNNDAEAADAWYLQVLSCVFGKS